MDEILNKFNKFVIDQNNKIYQNKEEFDDLITDLISDFKSLSLEEKNILLKTDIVSEIINIIMYKPKCNSFEILKNIPDYIY